jgi:cobalt-zinc-cadmium efflux system outer membrane protein
LEISHATDRIGSNRGARGIEATLSAPLKYPQVQAATAAQINAEQDALTLQHELVKLDIAGKLRELVAAHAQATSDLTQATRHAQEAATLAADVERRVKAGDLPRVDVLTTNAAVLQAQATVESAKAQVAAVQAAWAAATGTNAPPAALPAAKGAHADRLDQHPALAAARAALTVANAKLRTTQSDRRDPVEVGVSATSERSARGERFDNGVRVSVRIPFGGDLRNSAAGRSSTTEVSAAMAQLEATERTLRGDTAAAQAQVASAQQRVALARQRNELAQQAHALYARAFAMGEKDLPTLLRAQNEKFEAAFALERAQLDRTHAVSIFEHTLGLLP